MNRLLVPKTPPHAPETMHAAWHPSGMPWTMIVLAGRLRRDLVRLDRDGRPSAAAVGGDGFDAGVAVAAASLVGPAQVAARLVEFALLRRSFADDLGATCDRTASDWRPLLALFGPIMAVPFVLLHGAGNGMLTIARGTLPLALFGPAGYGLRTGLLSAPARILQGGAPLLFGVVLDRAGRACPAAVRRAHGCIVPGIVVAAYKGGSDGG